MKLLTIILLLVGTIPSAAGIDYESVRHERRLKPVRIAETIAIDGSLDEPAWSKAPVAKDFIQNEPRPNEPASEKTEIRMLYDDINVYFGCFMSDSRSNRLVINELKKDFDIEYGDSIEVILDTFHDERNGYVFSTNVEGAKYDSQMINEGREVNSNWDGIWFVKTSSTAEGWFAEMAIPFKTLKFRSLNIQTWGINFHRNLRSDRRNEDSFWSPLPRIYGLNRVSLAGTIEDLEGIKPGVNLKIKPYVSTSLTKNASDPYKGDADFGVDAKYGLTSGLTWDFTYNTDFSQVEADEEQINLTRFDLYFPEKRDFFLENSGIFRFGPSTSSQGGLMSGNNMIFFFSRRIGLSNDGEPIPILGGTRLTGRASKWELGILDMQQQEYGETRATNFAVGRLRRNLFGNSDIGIMMNNKESEGSHYNRVIGGDANFRLGQTVNVNAIVAKSFSPLAGKDTQNMVAGAGFEYQDQTYTLRSSLLDIQENFTDEMGFVPRTGIRKYSVYPEYCWRPNASRKWVRSMSPHVHMDYIEEPPGKIDTRKINYHYAIRFQDGSFLEPGINRTMERITEPFTISRAHGIQVPPGIYNYDEYFILARNDQARRLYASVRFGLGGFYGGYKHSYEISASYRMSYKANASLEYTHANISLPQPNGHFKNHLLALRFNYSFSTTVFLNTLIQYNSDAGEWISNTRFNIIHRPLSDLFLVYNERRNSHSGDLIDRALILKLTYMLAK
jgi:hypothetical protein